MGDDHLTVVGDNEEAKVRTDGVQMLRETKPYDSIDDVIVEFSSLEEYVAPVKGFVKQGQDVTPDPDHRFIYKEDITEMNLLFDEYAGKAGRAKFEELLRRIESPDRLVRRQTNRVVRRHENNNQDSNPVLETVDSPHHESFQQEQHQSQANVQSVEPVKKEEYSVDVKPDRQINKEDPTSMTTTTTVAGFLRRMARGYGNLGSTPKVSFILGGQSNTTDKNSTIILNSVDSSRPHEPLQQEMLFSQVNEKSMDIVEPGSQVIELKGLLQTLLDDDSELLPTIILNSVDSSRSHEPLQQEMLFSQVNEKSMDIVEPGSQMIELKGLLQTLLDDDSELLPQSVTTNEPLKFSNQTKFVCLTKNDTIDIMHADKVLEFLVQEVQPESAVSLVDCDLNLEIDTPEGIWRG